MDLVFRKIRQKKRSYGLLGADLGTEQGWKGSLEGTGTKELNQAQWGAGVGVGEEAFKLISQ